MLRMCRTMNHRVEYAYLEYLKVIYKGNNDVRVLN